MKKGGVKAEWVWLPIFALFLLWAGPAPAAENAECLKCHNNPKLSKGKKDGSLISLHVNEEGFKASVHGAGGLGCTDCHQEAKATQHPAEGFPEAGCASCHADQVEAYKKTSHGMMRESGMENAPRCADCHTAHYIRKVADPLSPVSEARLPSICAQCHWQAKRPSGFFTALATYRIMGHPKGDLGEKYNTQACVKCHSENTGHPPKPLQTTCGGCHDKSLATPMLLGPIHLQMTFHDNPLQFILRILYGLGLVAVVLGAVGWFGYRTYQKRKLPKPEATGENVQPPESGT
ncbi:MAG: doubled protein [Deltaproteobacteria bacterium]|nr:doubled protein [Deltaproteobacteria bacterium]